MKGFVHQTESMHSRLASLHKKVNQLPLQPHNLLEEVFEELSTALEELHVAHEDLHRQNEELVAARQAVEAQRQRYQDLFDFAPDAYLVTDAAGIIQEANCAAAILFNSSQQSLVGIPLAHFVPLEERKVFRSQLKQLGKNISSPQEWEVRLCPHKGEPFDAAFRVAAFQNREQEPISLRWILRDITRAKQVEAALRESEERFRSLVDNIPGAVYKCACDCDWTMEFISDAIQEMSGYRATDFIHNCVRTFASIIHPEDAAMVERVVQKGVDARQPYVVEYRIIHADGSVRWVYEKGQGIFDEDGNLLWLDGAIFDISDRKQLEAQRSRREQQLSDCVNNGAIALHWVGADRYILWANQAELDLLGYSHEEYIGHHISQSIKFPLQDSSGFPDAVCGISTDITPCKQAQEELRQLNTALENAVEGISRLDSQGRYIAVNKAYASTLGYQPEEMIGMAWQLTVHPDDLQKLVDAYQQMLKAGKAEVEARGVRKDGSIFYKQVVMVAAYDSQGQFIGHHCFAKDITKRQQIQEAIKQAKQELEIRVEDRTAQLRTANEQLLSEVVERKRAEVELEKSLSLLEATLESTADGILVIDREGKAKIFNHKFLRMWGFPESITSWEPQEAFALIQEQLKDPQAFLSRAKELYSQPEMESYDILEFKDGRVFDLYSQPQRIGGTIVGRVLSFCDITERKQAQDELERSLSLLRGTLEATADGIIVSQNGRQIATVNQKFLEMWGIPESVIASRDLNQLLPLILDQLKDPEAFMSEVQDLLSQQEAQGYGIFELKDGRIFERYSLPQRIGGNIVGRVCSFRDITERKRAELELQQREQKYRNLFHNSLVGMFRTTLAEGTVLDANEAILKMFGSDSYEGVKVVDCYVNPADRETLKQVLLERGFVENFETQVRRKDGSVFWVSYSGRLYAKEGYLEGMMIDITKRKLAEEALKKAHDELEIRVEERTAQLKQAIARFQELARREALLNRLASQIRNSLALDTILETAVQEIYNRLAIDVCVFAWYRPEGTPSGWDVVKEAKNPDLPSFLGFNPLESWRPFTCKLVNQEEFQVDNLTESELPEEQRLLPYGTAAVLSLPIVTQSGQLGTLTCGRLVSLQSWTDEELELLQAVANQLVIGINQAQLYSQSHIAATTAQTKATQLEVALRKLQHAQAQLIQSEKMSSLGQLVAGVAHEINNPISFIYGNLPHVNQYAQDLLNLIQHYQEYHPHSAREIQAETEAIDLDFIKKDLLKVLSSMQVGAERIRNIVLSLRNFSRLDEAEMKCVDIHEGLDNTLLILAHRLKAKQPEAQGIQVIKHYSKLPQVQCYPGQLNQVFMNILSNAIEALDDYNKERSLEEIKNHPGLIWICTEVLADSNQVIILIGDNGPGMTPEVRHRIFDPFFTTKPVGQGTGLGMSISYKIVLEKHGGQLECISAPGLGTAFLIYIPIQQQRSLR